MSKRCEHCGAAWAPAHTLTRRRQEVFHWIRDFIEEHGQSPTLREIADGIGVTSESTVHEHVRHLEQEGLIRKGDHKQTRSLQVLVEAPDEEREPEELIGWGDDPL